MWWLLEGVEPSFRRASFTGARLGRAPAGGPGHHGCFGLAGWPCGRPSWFESSAVGPPLRLWWRQQQSVRLAFSRDAREDDLGEIVNCHHHTPRGVDKLIRARPGNRRTPWRSSRFSCAGGRRPKVRPHDVQDAHLGPPAGTISSSRSKDARWPHPTTLVFSVNLPHPHTHTPGNVSSLRSREVRWPRHIPHTTPPPLCPVCFHHAASLAPSSSSHSRSRRTMLQRASPALEHSDKTDHQTELSPVQDSRRGSVSCSAHGIQFFKID